MVTKFNNYIKEGLSDYLKGPTDEELLKELKHLDPTDALFKCVFKHTGFLNGVIQAVEDGADLTKRDSKMDFTALEYAIVNNFPEICKYLMEKNASLDENSFTPLYFLQQTTKNGNVDFFKYVIKKYEYCLDLTDANEMKETAKRLNHDNLVDFLSEYIYAIEECTKQYIRSL